MVTLIPRRFEEASIPTWQSDVYECVEHVRRALEEQADSEKARAMQAYMKTDMPFYGVQSSERKRILARIVAWCAPGDQAEYESLVLALWSQPHREEKYLAQGVATAHKRFIVPGSLPMCQRMIAEGSWWDFVDEVATHMVRPVVVDFPEETWPVVEGWIDHEVMWFRRAAIICQIGAKGATDTERLFGFCAARAHETEFFIRKAIGWALREYAKTDPRAVAGFAIAHRDDLSGLSFREATKHIGELVG